MKPAFVVLLAALVLLVAPAAICQWVPTSITSGDVHALLAHGQKMYAGASVNYGRESGIYLSMNGGKTWNGIDSALHFATPAIPDTVYLVYALAVHGDYVFAGTSGQGLWRRPLQEVVTSIPTGKDRLPSMGRLEQNYPNPFNPTTMIRYSLPHRSHVTLTVFNTLGQQIAGLVNGDIDAGYHEVQFDASKLASGVYFYRVQAGNYMETRKLCVLK